MHNPQKFIAVAAALLVLTGCANSKPATPELSEEVIAIVDNAGCGELTDNLQRAIYAQMDDDEYNDEWGAQYEALIMWRGEQLGCSWA